MTYLSATLYGVRRRPPTTCCVNYFKFFFFFLAKSPNVQSNGRAHVICAHHIFEGRQTSNNKSKGLAWKHISTENINLLSGFASVSTTESFSIDPVKPTWIETPGWEVSWSEPDGLSLGPHQTHASCSRDGTLEPPRRCTWRCAHRSRVRAGPACALRVGFPS